MKSRVWLAGAILPALGAAAFADGNAQFVVNTETRTLVMTGDAAANDVLVTYDGVPGAFTLTGRNGTTVNLLPAVQVTGVLNFDVDMGAGSDVLEFSQTRIRGNLVVRLGDGDDALLLSGARVRGRTRIFAGEGADRVVASDHCVFNAFTARVEGGADNVQLLDSAFLNRCRVFGGDGADTILVHDDVFGTFARVEIRAGHEDDEVTIDSCNFKNDVFVFMDEGDDHLILDDNNFVQDAFFTGGGGDADDLSVRSGNNFKFDHRPRFRSFEK